MITALKRAFRAFSLAARSFSSVALFGDTYTGGGGAPLVPPGRILASDRKYAEVSLSTRHLGKVIISDRKIQ